MIQASFDWNETGKDGCKNDNASRTIASPASGLLGRWLLVTVVDDCRIEWGNSMGAGIQKETDRDEL